MNKIKNENLTIGRPYVSLLKFAAPLMLAYVLQQLYNTADTFIIGNFDSQKSLAAVGSCFNIIGLYIMISVGLSLGVGILVSEAFGAKDETVMKKYAKNGCVLLLFIGLIISVFSYFSAEWMLIHIVGVPESILCSAVVYMKIYSIGLFFLFGYNAFAGILRAVGNSKSSFYFLLLTTVINVILDLVFVIFLNWSVFGVAVATTISQGISMSVSYIYMIKKYPIFKMIKNDWHLNYKLSMESIKSGFPLALQSVIMNVGFMFLTNIANSFGENMTISFVVANRLEFFLLVPMIALWDATTTFSAQNFGAKKYGRLTEGMKQSIFINIIFVLACGPICFYFSKQLAEFFGIDGIPLEYASIHLKVISVDLLFYAIYSPITAMSAGIKKSYIVTVASVIELSGRILFSFLLIPFIGKASVWFNELFAWMIVVVFVYIYYFLVLKKVLNLKQTHFS